jgi:hypothetical protein
MLTPAPNPQTPPQSDTLASLAASLAALTATVSSLSVAVSNLSAGRESPATNTDTTALLAAIHLNQAEHAATLASLNNAVAALVAKDNTGAEIDLKAQLERARSERDAAIADARLERDTAIKKAWGECKAAIEDAQAERDAAVEEAHVARVAAERAHAEHRAAIEDMRAEHQAAVSEIHAEYDTAIACLESDLEAVKEFVARKDGAVTDPRSHWSQLGVTRQDPTAANNMGSTNLVPDPRKPVLGVNVECWRRQNGALRAEVGRSLDQYSRISAHTFSMPSAPVA